VVDELHEGRPDEPAEPGAWEEEVRGCEQGHRGDDGQAEQHFSKTPAPPPNGETFVPDGRQKLLAVWMGHKLQAQLSRKLGITFLHNYYKKNRPED